MSVPQNKLPMKPKAESIPFQLSLMRIKHENVSWSNILINSPITYNLLERRTMYFLTGEVKRKFVEKGLGVPDNWKDLYFYLTDEDLGLIGGSKNVPRTYEVLSTMGEKFVTVRYLDENGDEIIGKLHWVDTFFYDPKKDLYAVRVSPEIMPYLINLNKNFTCFDVGTAMKLRSKYTQKMYELCCRFGGDYTHYEHEQFILGNVYKKRVVPISMDDFRQLFNLDEIRDPKTGKVLQPASLENFKDMRRSILDSAQDELLTMYLNNASNVWFDYQTEGNGRKGGRERVRSNDFYEAENQERIAEHFLSKYLSRREVAYYMAQIRKEARYHKDSYIQVIQVIQEKEKQKKFAEGTRQYKRNNLIDFALKENLKDFGWSINPPATRRERKSDKSLFDER